MNMAQHNSETIVQEIPNDWKRVSLSKVADFINGYGFKTSDWRTKGVPIVRIQNLNDPSAEFNYFDGVVDRKYYLENGDLLLSWSASLGVYIWNRGRAVLNQHIFRVRPKSGISKDYLYYVSHKAIEDLKRRIHGSTMRHFKKRELDATSILVPPLVEQRKIARILSRVDETIQRTNELIRKTEMLKRGLTQRLLSRGIGHTKFKKTELGELPEKWGSTALGEICKVKGGKRLPKGYSFAARRTSHPYLRVVDFERGGVTATDLKYISEETHDQISRYIISSDDVFISIAGTIGLAGVIPKELSGSNLTENAAKLCELKSITPLFLSYVLNSEIGQLQIKRLIGVTSQPKLALFRIKKIIVPLPSISEQNEITSMLSALDKKYCWKKEPKTNLKS